MRKTRRKLGLAKETISTLSNEDLGRVAGGAHTEENVSYCVCPTKSVCICPTERYC
jgi:hypothetical protein